MDASQIDGAQYDYVHFGFGEVTADFKVDISDVQAQFETFKKQTGFKKIVSFGGWSFSTSEDSFPIFRTGVSDDNRSTFAQNAVDFIHANGLDGVDFDWEYPGAPDIPGIPPGTPQDGGNYLAFLKVLRSKLDASKTISIAAPASYWYLKGYPIAEMSEVLDYIVFMTYDLHGQWDYGSQFADQGCPGGSCLRSHVKYTETMNSLAMITKAGVPAAKVVVGIGSYGRSFQMSAPGCDGPMCTFTGPASAATPGLCTHTAGYISNAEIEDILRCDPTAKTHYDQGSDSNILIYAGDQWVAYMSDDTRRSRINSYHAMNFGGAVEWAIDLNQFYGPIHGSTAVLLSPDKTCPIAPHGSPLSQKSTCKDLEDWQSKHGLASGLCSRMWDLAGTSQYFSDWINKKWNRNNDFEDDFASQFGRGQSTAHSTLDNLRDAPDCIDMEHYDSQPGTGPEYMIWLSMYNVAQSLKTIRDAVNGGISKWDQKKERWQLDFNTGAGAASGVALKEAINAFGAVVAVLFGMLDPPAAAIGPLVTGIASGIILGLPDPETETIRDMAEFANYMDNASSDTANKITNVFTDFYTKGSSGDLALQDMFVKGAWVDISKIPLLQVSNQQTIKDAVAQQINAAALNWAWRQQGVWLMSYPMTQQDFDNFKSKYGNNDPNLKHYYSQGNGGDGRGYFFQSITTPDASPPISQTPPGYNKLDQFTFTIPQVVESSANSFAAGGFAYNPLTDIGSTIANHGNDILAGTFPGIFNTPICALDSSYGYTPTLKDFENALMKEGDAFASSTIPPSYCYCMGLQDHQGVKFEDRIDIAQWAHGVGSMCPDNANTVGGQAPNKRQSGISTGPGGGTGPHIG